MSNSTDPKAASVRDLICDRISLLEEEIADRQSRLAEVLAILRKIDDGRSTVNRKTRTNSAAPPATQPGLYDDSVSLDEAQGVLAP